MKGGKKMLMSQPKMDFFWGEKLKKKKINQNVHTSFECFLIGLIA